MFEQEIKVVFNRKVSAYTFQMGFRSPEIAAESRPGQFIMVRVNSGMDPLLRRPFSVCGVRHEDLFCILYRVVGRGTKILSEKEAGESLSVLGPLGKEFEIPGSNKKVLLVAGGIGVAPLLFLAQEMISADMEFMIGFTSSSEIIDFKQTGNMPFNISLATDDGSRGYAGMVTDLLNEYLQQNPVEKESFCIYTCGPVPMLKKVASIAADRNIPCQVSLETLMACGLGACQGCAVKASSRVEQEYYHHVCKDGPVFPVHAIDWKKI